MNNDSLKDGIEAYRAAVTLVAMAVPEEHRAGLFLPLAVMDLQQYISDESQKIPSDNLEQQKQALDYVTLAHAGAKTFYKALENERNK